MHVLFAIFLAVFGVFECGEIWCQFAKSVISSQMILTFDHPLKYGLGHTSLQYTTFLFVFFDFEILFALFFMVGKS